MRTIFECETEVGRCDLPSAVVDGEMPWPGSCMLVASTTAYVNGSKHMLRIEQRSYFRVADAIPEQPWVAPAIKLEPVLGSEEETLVTLQKIHLQFVQKTRAQIYGDPPPVTDCARDGLI